MQAARCMVDFTAMGIMALSGIVKRDSIILVGFIELAIRHGRRLIDAVLKSGVVRENRTLLMVEAARMTSPRFTFNARFSGLWSHIFLLTSSELFTLFLATVSLSLLKAKKSQNNIDKLA
jgi:hypothetical protein